MQTTDDGEAGGRAVLLGLSKAVQRPAGVQYVRGDAEALTKFALPLFAEHRRTEHQQPTKIESRAQFSPEQASFDCLPESNLVSDQDAAADRIHELDDRLDRRAARLDGRASQRGADPLHLRPGRARAGRPDRRRPTLSLRVDPLARTRATRKPHLDATNIAAGAGPIGDDSDPARIVL